MNRKYLIAGLIIVGVLVIINSVLVGRQNNDHETPSPVIIGTLKGVSLSPRSFQSSDFTNFFEKARQAGSLVSWAGDWIELGRTSGGPEVVTTLSIQYELTPVVEAQFFSQSSGALLRPLNDSTRRLYVDTAATFAERHKPKYLAFGIEVNVLYEKSPAEFDDFVQLFGEVFDAVKAKSPDTKVFTIFQLERMKGLNGGLFGGVNDPSKAQWHLLGKLNKTDLIAFTTYPGLIYRTPSEIPASYYSEIRSHTSKPIAFTEIGWHSEASPAGWESSESEQAEFVTRFFALTKGLNKEMVVWSFLYDQATIEPFRSMGLLRNDGTPRPAWNAWLKGEG